MKQQRTTELGTFVTARRIALRLTQKQIAQRVHVSPSVICGIEIGTCVPGSEMLEKIFLALECEIPTEFKNS